MDPIFSELDHSGVQDIEVRQILEYYVNVPDMNLVGSNPLGFKNVADEQQTDHKLQVLKQRLPNQWIDKSLDPGVRDITCYVKEHHDSDTKWRIYLPGAMLKTSITWFH